MLLISLSPTRPLQDPASISDQVLDISQGRESCRAKRVNIGLHREIRVSLLKESFDQQVEISPSLAVESSGQADIYRRRLDIDPYFEGWLQFPRHV
jgi:hypothetical protein